MRVSELRPLSNNGRNSEDLYRAAFQKTRACRNPGALRKTSHGRHPFPARVGPRRLFGTKEFFSPPLLVQTNRKLQKKACTSAATGLNHLQASIAGWCIVPIGKRESCCGSAKL